MTNKDLQVAINNVRTTTVLAYPNKGIKHLVQFLVRKELLVIKERAPHKYVIARAAKLRSIELQNLTNNFLKLKNLVLEKRRRVDESYGDLLISTPRGLMLTSQCIDAKSGGILLGVVHYNLQHKASMLKANQDGHTKED